MEWVLDPATGTFKKVKSPRRPYPSRDAEYRRAYHAVKYREDEEYRQRVQERERTRRHVQLVDEVPLRTDACQICGATDSGLSKLGNKKSLHLDHDHATGRFRGWLCGHCNAGIGMFRDDPELMGLAIEYLQAHKDAK